VLAQIPLLFGTTSGCSAIIDTRLTGLTIADICDGSSRLDAYVYVDGNFSNTPLGPYRVFSPNEPLNFTGPIPIGQHVIRYLGQDSYGAETILDIDFAVVDTDRPSALCRESISLTLNEAGSAVLSAADLDAGSFDNCSSVVFSVARPADNVFRETIVFNCGDFGGPTPMTLRVADATGFNSSDCSVMVTVQDAQRPVCSAPPSTDITCQTFSNNLPVNLREEFTTDPAGTAALLDATFGRLPGDQNYDSCADLPTPEDLILGEGGCDLLTVSTQTDTLADDGNACYQLRLTHTFINWCEYDGGSAALDIPRDADNDGNLRPTFYLNIDPAGDAGLTDDKAILDRDVVNNNGNEIGALVDLYGSSARRGHFRYVQLVTVSDNVAPAVDLPAPDNGQAITDDCLGGLLISFTATDDCTVPETVIALDVDVADRNGDDTITGPDFLEDRQVSPNRFTTMPDGSVEVSIRFLPIGRHLARIRTTDDCGNLSESFVPLTVEDGRAPRPDCSTVNTVALTPDPAFGGIAALLADDFISGPATVCTETPVTYSIYREEVAARAGFVPQTGEIQLNLDCSDLGQNLLRVYAIAEETGRHDYCNISVNITSAGDLCAGRLGIIDGYVLTETGEPMAGIEVFATTDGQEIGITTEDDGYYRFDGLAEGADYAILPYNNDNPINGLSTFDISLVSDYLTEDEEEPLSPYQLIAADANNSRAITILDLIEIREILLGIDDGFDNNTSWRFVPPDNGGSSGRASGLLALELRHGESGNWSLLTTGEVSPSGIQFSMALPAGTRIVGGIARGYRVVDRHNVLHLSYVPEDGRPLLPGEPLLLLQLPGDAPPAFADDRLARLAPEAYLPGGRVLGLELTLSPRLISTSLVVSPNPVSAASVLSFDWPVREQLRLEVIDVSGRVVSRRNVSAVAGHNALPLEMEETELENGVYFFRLFGHGDKATVRVLVAGR